MERWIVNLLIPLIMIIFGLYFYIQGPKTINPFFGYRTSMSMKNEITWRFAHRFCGKIWIIVGILMMGVTIVFLFSDMLTLWKNYFILWQVVVLIVSIIPVELALRKKFDKNGKKRMN